MILIAYASKSGFAKEAAEILAKTLPPAGLVDLVDLTQKTPALDGYDSVIVGAGVRVGAINKAAKSFLDNNRVALGSKRLGIFISNCFADSTDEVLKSSVPEELRSSAVWIGSVGGRLDTARLKGIDKMIAKAASRAVKEDQKVYDGLDHAALEELASCFH